MSNYTVYITPPAWKEIKDLPGNVRQRVRRAVEGLGVDPRPTRSKRLDTPDLKYDLYRLRMARWRIVYAITEDDLAVDVLAVRRRPPYDYGDLESLTAEIQ
jgi:mRNA interferase RelE/StbE